MWGRDECRGSWAVSNGEEVGGTRTESSRKSVGKNNFSSNLKNFTTVGNSSSKTLHDDFDQNLHCFQVTECVVRPDIELKKIIASAMRVGEVKTHY